MSSLYIITCLTAFYSEHLQIYSTAVEPHNFIWGNSVAGLNTFKVPGFISICANPYQIIITTEISKRKITINIYYADRDGENELKDILHNGFFLYARVKSQRKLCERNKGRQEKFSHLCRLEKREIFSPGKLLKCFVALFVRVCKEEKKPLNSHWSDFLLKLCQNVVESEVLFLSLIDISQIPDAFLLSNYSCDSDHVSTLSCKRAVQQSVSRCVPGRNIDGFPFTNVPGQQPETSASRKKHGGCLTSRLR